MTNARRNISPIADDLASSIEGLLKDMHCDLQSIEGSLRKHSKGYVIQGLVCMSCGRTHPALAKKCHPCRNNELFPKYCTTDYRVAEYFMALRKAELWPSPNPFQTLAASDLAYRMACAKRDLRHDCAAGYLCPLGVELAALEKMAHANLNRVKGLNLYPLHQDPNILQNNA